MSLKEIIKTLNYKNLSSEQIFVVLNQKNITYIDNTLWTWAGIAMVAGNEGAESLKIALEQNGMGWAVHQLGGSGLDLSIEPIQSALYYMDSIGVPGMKNVALSIKRNESILEKYKIVTNIEEVESILKELLLEDEKKRLLELAFDRLNQFKINILNWNGIDAKPEL